MSILRQFLDGIKEHNKNDEFVVFVDPGFNGVEIENVRYVSVDTRGWRKRIQWDRQGFKEWIDENGIKPGLIVSLQNTGVNYSRDVPQLIYYHQLLAISCHKWNPLRQGEFLLFCYRNFYQYFVRRYMAANTHVVVQMPFIKKEFLGVFDVPEANVHVIPPKIERYEYDGDKDEEERVVDCVRFIYPATGVVYKNHIVLLKALRLLQEEEWGLFDKVRLFFTLKEGDNRKVDKCVKRWGLEDAVVLGGVMPFQELLACYKNMDALLFPSFIETVGLPLLEAAGCGMAIKAADLPYAHEVLHGYEGVSYVDYQDERAWAKAIKDVCLNRKRYVPMKSNDGAKGWKDFFELVDRLKLKS